MKQEGTKKRNRLLRNAWVLLFALAWVVLPFALSKTVVQADDLSDTRIRASLSGPAINGVTPSGFAEHRTDDDNRRRLEVQASSVNLPQGTVLNVVLNNAVVGQMTVNQFNGAFLSIDTNNGQNVPPASNGNPIAVMNGNTTVVSGVFGIVTATPSPSGSPTGSPTASPSVSPTVFPSVSPSVSPSASPSVSPTVSPTVFPTVSPSVSPTASPSVSPTVSPTVFPSVSPTASPTGSPNPSPTVSPSPGNNGDLFAGLSGPTLNGVLPNGFAQYEFHSSRIELEIRVRQVNLPGGTMLNVVVNNATVGQMFISSGEGRLRLRSDDGHNVPIITAGSTIIIYNGSSAILSGIFSGASPSPSPSPSVSPTGSPSPSPSVSPTVSPSPNVSPSPSPSVSPSPSPSPVQGRYFEGNLSSTVNNGSRGELKIFLNATETQAQVTGEFNLSSQQTTAKIVSDIGGVVVHDFGTIGGTQGQVNVTFNVTPAQVQQIRAGLWYAVFGSVANPNEVRGVIRNSSRSSDFDGDGVVDMAVFRPQDGAWYIQNSTGFSATIFGGANDKLVSGDFDGDGRSDAAVYRSNSNGAGIWDIKRSSDGGQTTEQFGLSTDIPVRGDYDGDGLQDLAVFRPGNGYWYIKRSTDAGYTIVQFGQNGDKPVPADLDGDGKTDIVVFRPSVGDWYWLGSRDGLFRGLHFGVSEDLPIAGDFDGDGRDDLTVYRPSVGSWYRINSSNDQFVAVQFGISTDSPVAGDYDKDGKMDIAVFRKAEGAWYILRSSDGAFEARFFGLNGDIPIPAQ
jgi:hypothetical protein